MVDLDEMMDKINNINARVEELYSKAKEAVNSDCYLKSCIAQQAKVITGLTCQVDNQKDTIKAIAKERDNLAASLETEKAHAKICNDNFYEYRLSSNGAIKGYKQELDKVRSERETVKALNEQLKADFNFLAKNHKKLGEAFNRLNGEYLDLKKEHDNLVKAADKYSWKRVDTSNPLPFEDHELYLFAIDGYTTPVKGKFHDNILSNITIIVDDGKGKGPEQKTIFFMDGRIRYWTPLPEMPDMPKGVDDDD